MLSNSNSRLRQRRSGWTLVEMMIATCSGMLILGSLLSVYVFMRRTLDATANYQALDGQSRNALDKMTTDIRQCGRLTNYDATHLWFTNLDGSMLQYTYDPNAHTLSYTNGSSITPGSGILLNNLATGNATNSLWQLFIRTPSNGTTMDFFPIPYGAPASS